MWQLENYRVIGWSGEGCWYANISAFNFQGISHTAILNIQVPLLGLEVKQLSVASVSQVFREPAPLPGGTMQSSLGSCHLPSVLPEALLKLKPCLLQQALDSGGENPHSNSCVSTMLLFFHLSSVFLLLWTLLVPLKILKN